MKKIAITGGVASGKSTVCRIFRELGAFVVNADAIAHALLDSDTDLGQQIIRQFGSDILIEAKINRRMLAEKVFKDPQQLEKLEKLLHPAVLRTIEELYLKQCDSGKYTSFVVEIPLLFEIRGESFYDWVITVLADDAIARRRFQQAGFTLEEYDRRMKRQLYPGIKAKRAHFTIENNGTIDDLKNQVVALNKILT
ncbi:MAG TPA: dephospho-CoA kinase [Chlamydiales bacterium]|nr:dephospho-CoA kinase [Chlamydiales bacterium]